MVIDMVNNWRGKVLDYIMHRVSQGKVHMTLLDPEKQIKFGNTKRIVEYAYSYGTDAIMVGGSTGLNVDIVENTVAEIKDTCPLPVILFPSGVHAVARNADAIYFMSVLNSRNPEFIVGEQMRGAKLIKSLGLEVIPMGYIIVEPGMAVGKVSNSEVVKRDDIATAVAYALTAQYFGMALVYFEAGSGAPLHVPVNMIQAIKDEIDIPLIIGGGIRDPVSAGNVAGAGADIIVTGTVVETSGSTVKLKEIIKAVKGEN